MKSYKEIGVLEGKRIVLRLDLNVPIEKGEVRDSFRIDRALPFIKELSAGGAKVFIISHIECEEKTLLPVFEYIKARQHISFAKNLDEAKALMKDLKNGDVVFVENIRQYEGEKKNDPELSKKIAELGEVYINNAFSVSHRPHASVVGVPALLPHYAGPLLIEEVDNLKTAFNPEHPFLFVLGGAKFSTKVPLINRFLNSVDYMYICGALSSDLLKVKGQNIGKSLVSVDDSSFKMVEEIAKNPKVYMPNDVVVSESIGKDLSLDLTKSVNSISDSEAICDVGANSVNTLIKMAAGCKYVLWNGPLGNYENGYSAGTENLARALAKLTAEKGVKTIVGGGDTVAVISNLGLDKSFSFLSTGGGAMLDFLANESLPGIKALE